MRFPQLGFLVPLAVGVLAAAEPVGLPLQGEVEFHQGGQVLWGAHAPHGGKTAPPAGGPAKQREANGV